MMTLRAARLQRGFTLVEVVMVIVIIGILGGMVAIFIRAPLQSYVDSVNRAELSDAADLALRRMARDLRLALPNSIRISPAGDSIEFLITRTGGRYLAAEDGIDSTTAVLDFLDPNNKSVTVVGGFPDASQLTPGSDYFVANNLGPGFAPANAYDLASTQRNIAKVSAADPSKNLITLADNPFAAQLPPSPSPSRRFQIVSGPVTYSCGLESNGTRMLTRQSGYPITSLQSSNPVPVSGANGKRSILAGRVKSCLFQYQALASQRSGLVILALELQPLNAGQASIRLVHQVHVDNAP
jgi:MSHA biogenesis protein MshO